MLVRVQIVHHRDDVHVRKLRNGEVFQRPGKVPTLVEWKLDRLGRSLRQPVQTVDQPHKGEDRLRVLVGPLAADTSDPAGRIVFHVFAALSEYEREPIRERARASIAAARARGKMAGQPWTPMSKFLEAAELMNDPMCLRRQRPDRWGSAG